MRQDYHQISIHSLKVNLTLQLGDRGKGKLIEMTVAGFLEEK